MVFSIQSLTLLQDEQNYLAFSEFNNYNCVCLLASLLVRAKISSANSLINTNPLGLLSKQGYERSYIPDNKLGTKRYVL
ncbi:hypothetical protein BEL04_18105 [Mucilaginibacter sp. PPCGB 2223]|nr:hypothetical protein BEL04_18105 [Mucilaginibacter sp. PPCGB 2223]